MTSKDKKAILVIGAGVGILIQPVLANLAGSLPPWFHLTLPVRFGMFFFFLVFAPFALFVARLLARVMPGIYQFAQFAAVGTLNTFIDLGVLNLETLLYEGSVVSTPLFGLFKAFSFLCATTNSFFWNKYWTFNAKEKPHAGEVAGFYTVAVIGWILNVGTAIVVKISGPADSRVWTNLVAPLAGVAAAFLWDFFGFKYFVFKKGPPA